jgi:hypothetical protein
MNIVPSPHRGYIISQAQIPISSDAPTYQFPTSLPKRDGLTPFQKQQREIEFENHPAFRNRRIVTIIVVSFAVALFVADVLRDGFNRNAACASICGVTAAYLVRRFVASQNGTSQNYPKP